MYELKRLGPYWLIRQDGGQWSRLQIPAHAQKVELLDDFLVVDEVIYVIQTYKQNVYIKQVPDVSFDASVDKVGHENLPENNSTEAKKQAERIDDISRSNTMDQRCEAEDSGTGTIVENNYKRKDNAKNNLETPEIVKEQKELQTAVTNFPVKIFFDSESDEASAKVPDSLNMTQCDFQFQQNVVNENNQQDNDVNNLQTQIKSVQISSSKCVGNFSVIHGSDEIHDRRISLEMESGQIEYDSLEAGQTEETPSVEIVTNTANTDENDDSKSECELANCWKLFGTLEYIAILQTTDDLQKVTHEISRAGIKILSRNPLKVSVKTIKQMVFLHRRLDACFTWTAYISDVPDTLWEILHRTKLNQCTVQASYNTSKHLISIEAAKTSFEEEVEGILEYFHTLRDKKLDYLQVEKGDENMAQQFCQEYGSSTCVYVADKSVCILVSDSAEELTKIKDMYRIKTGTDRQTSKQSKGDATGNLSGQKKQTVKSFVNVTKYSLSNVMIIVCKGNIVEAPVDCIVNSTNQNLSHGGGLAHVISKAAGPSLTREGEEIIKKRGKLKVGTACTTTAGSLPFRCVIHAVGPNWSDYKPHTPEKVQQCLKDIHDAVYNSLLLAGNYGCKTVALPAISSGIFMVPLDLCVSQYTRASLNYNRISPKDGKHLQEIYFVDPSKSVTQRVSEAFAEIVEGSDLAANCKILLNNDNNSSTNPLRFDGIGVRLTARKADEVKTSSSGAKPSELPYGRQKRSEDMNMLRPTEKLTVYVYTADLIKVDVDCIVSASNEHLQHGGGVAHAIARAAGQQLVDDGNSYVRQHGPLKVGTTCVTSAGRLPYRCVIQAVGPKWVDYCPYTVENVKKCGQDLYNAIMNSFLRADEQRCRSIALPAISSAIFGVPEDLCVYQYARATLDYSRASITRPGSLTEIHFVDLNPNMTRKIHQSFTDAIYGTALDKTECFVQQIRTKNRQDLMYKSHKDRRSDNM